jgi:5'-3' exonuclease
VKQKKVRLLIDFSIILRKNFDQYEKGFEYAEMESDQFKEYALWRHMVIQGLFELYNNIHPDEIILACDSKSWRKEYYPKYKANRTYAGMNQYFNESNKLIDELKNSFPFKLLKIDGLEGDDIIALFCINKPNDINVVGSIDSDLHQLLLYPNVIYYNINDKKSLELSREAIKEKLLMKLLKGDPGDNVPNIYTEKIVKGTRQKSVIKSLIEECSKDIIKVMQYDEAMKARYERNKKLIFLSNVNIPLDLQKKMWDYYEGYEIEGTKEKLMNYFDEWKMELLKERINEINSLWNN